MSNGATSPSTKLEWCGKFENDRFLCFVTRHFTVGDLVVPNWYSSQEDFEHRNLQCLSSLLVKNDLDKVY